MVTTFPLGYNVPTWLQRSHMVTTFPHGYNVPKTLQFNDFDEMTPALLLVMTCDMTKAYIFVFLMFPGIHQWVPFLLESRLPPSSFLVFAAWWCLVFPMVFQQLVLRLILDVPSMFSSAISLDIPFLLLLIPTLYIETGLLLWAAFNCFVLLPAMWVLTGLAMATFWVRFASLVLPIYNFSTFVMSLWMLVTPNTLVSTVI